MDQISIQKGRIVTLEEGNGLEKIIDKVQAPVAAVVVMACNRANYLERALKSILKYQSSVPSKYPLFVSQDGEDPDVKTKALSYNQLTYMQHLDHEPVHTESPKEMIVYYKIARHYKWALDQLFYKHNFSRVIILEDDMEISPDFFDYFEAAVALLESDKSIMAVSSWNDNGQKQFVQDPYMLYRSDFFPGLGWMLAKSTWDELSPKWTKAYPCGVLSHSLLFILAYYFNASLLNIFFDISLRKLKYLWFPDNLACFCLTLISLQGSSLGQYFKQYLEPIKLNGVQVDWKSMDLNYLMEDKYVKHFADMVKNARPVCGTDDVLKECNIDCDVRIQYKDKTDFEHIAHQFGIFEEWKHDVPRTAYKGVVVFRYQSPKRVFLVGPESLQHLGI
ncbi:alpha-1,3-mannosyl-glycoprotein 2-beta-N-acetylglucosaminyltransferase-like [Camellia sinensis]|uniref:alpha-1,3-mannosyl-glycoprotein 2-beta-N-acetylglucosaminyltransferase-like n=1 Tax=Camellia sinensis TaxID=4442 RepID=UPI0010362512|nr:alpha-1,3-mannosyl-glycoprotein 2-beta-N-acetylglucosaminyltransferase-like [Camellia sinensis]